jgi:anti-sigma regulatory factor (Ser/Thr protein kinase)
MQAAAHMGQLRSMLRALAWSHDESPSVLLTLLDRANHQLGPRVGATAVVVRLDRVALLDARRQVATTLQAALLTPPPTVAHLDIATTYEPATRTDQVGGDWYDVVAVDEDTTLLIIGDVAGHDMQAAAHMGQLRSMLRALAWSHDESPSVLLTLLDRANHQLGPRVGATAIVMRLIRLDSGSVEGPGTYAVTWSNAGHPPPLVLRATGDAEVLDARPDMLLGIHPTVDRTDHATTLHPGETLLLYTDGLVEARGEALADRITLLAQTFGRAAHIGTSDLPRALVRALVPAPQRDDVAVLAVRARVAAPRAEVPTAPARPVRAERQLAETFTDLGPTRRWIDDILETSGVAERERHVAMLLSSELLTNALEHGTGPVVVTVEVNPAGADTGRLIRVSVRDGSPRLPQMQHPEPHDLSGRGVQFLDQLSSRWGVVAAQAPEVGKTVFFELAD